MKCHQIKPLLDEFLEGELSSPQKEVVERHLEGCSSCREEVSALRRTIYLIAEFGEVNEPPDFLCRVRQRIDAPERCPLLERLTQRPLIARAVAFVGCVMLVAIGGWFVYRQLSPTPPPSVAHRTPRSPRKPERIALVRNESELPLAEAGRELDLSEGRIEEKAPSHKGFGEGEWRAGETVGPSAPHEQDWSEVPGTSNLDAVSKYFYTNGRAYDAIVTLNGKAGQTAHAAEEFPAEQSQRLFSGKEVALKKKGVEVGTQLSPGGDANQTDLLDTPSGPASERLSSAGGLVQQRLEPTSHAEGGQPASAKPGPGLGEIQERVRGPSLETAPSPVSRYGFSYRDVRKEDVLPEQPPARSSDIRTAGDEYKSAPPQDGQELLETAIHVENGATAEEYLRSNRMQSVGKPEGAPDGTDDAHLGLQYAPTVDEDAGMPGLRALLDYENKTVYGDAVPEFLLTVQNRRKALDEIRRFVADLGGKTESVSLPQVPARGVALQQHEGLVIILPRAGYEKFQDRFPLRPAARGRIVVRNEPAMTGQVERRRAQTQETITFILRVMESSQQRPSQEAAP